MLYWLKLQPIGATLQFLVDKITAYMWDYNSIILVAMTVFLFLKFRTIKIENTKIAKAITFVSPSVIAIYIIHNNIHFKSWWRKDYSWGFADSSMLLPYIVSEIIMVFIICLAIDLLRRGLYILLKKIPIVHRFVDVINTKIEMVNVKLNSYLE